MTNKSSVEGLLRSVGAKSMTASGNEYSMERNGVSMTIEIATLRNLIDITAKWRMPGVDVCSAEAREIVADINSNKGSAVGVISVAVNPVPCLILRTSLWVDRKPTRESLIEILTLVESTLHGCANEVVAAQKQEVK